MMWVLNLIQFALPVALILVGVFAGKWTERRHFRRLAIRESALSDMLCTDTRSLPAGCTVRNKSMVVGEVVVASDYFKTFVSKLRRIVGGELRAFETLMEPCPARGRGPHARTGEIARCQRRDQRSVCQQQHRIDAQERAGCHG